MKFKHYKCRFSTLLSFRQINVPTVFYRTNCEKATYCNNILYLNLNSPRMEVINDGTTMQCYKIPCKVMGNLKISCDITNSNRIVLWSKYLLLIYEYPNLGNYLKKIEPQFEIEDVIVLKHYLFCLDCSGNVNIDTFESFIIWKHNIKHICACEIMETCYVVCLQLEQNKPLLLVNVFNMNDSSNDGTGLELKMPDQGLSTPEKSCILVCSHIKPEYSIKVKNIFNVAKPVSNFLLIIVSLDKRNVYAALIPIENIDLEPHMDPSNLWIKVYKSYTEVVDIKVKMTLDICILVGLASGNIIKIPLLLKKEKPDVYHLNTTISKFTMKDDIIIYSDVLTMWQNKDIFSKLDSIFEQFVVRNVRDFCVIENIVICVNFSNLIYTFNIYHWSAYVNPPDADYSCAVQVVTNSDYLKEIMDTVKQNEELHKKINKESEYLMALSLSKRQDIMHSLIQVTATVFDDYKDLVSKNTNLLLTDELDAYFDSYSYYFLINILVNRVQHKLNKLLSDVLGHIKIHITLSAHGILKTTSIQVKEQLTTKNFVIPLKRKYRNIKRMEVHVKIITNIPGKYDENQRLWTILYQTCIYLNAENFINMKNNSNSTLLKDDETPLEMLIYKRAKHLHAEYKFHITDNPRYDWNFFIKLPTNSSLQLENILQLIDPLNSKRVFESLKNLVKVTKLKNILEFQIGTEQVKLNIEDGNLKVTCPDIVIASDIRNFLSSIIFTALKFERGKELIDHKYYATIENLKREISNCNSKRISAEEFATLVTRFLRSIYCLIPI